VKQKNNTDTRISELIEELRDVGDNFDRVITSIRVTIMNRIAIPRGVPISSLMRLRCLYENVVRNVKIIYN